MNEIDTSQEVILLKKIRSTFDNNSAIDVGDVFISVLQSISSAISDLKKNNIRVDMQEHPVEIFIECDLVEVSKYGNEVSIKIKHSCADN